MNRRDYHSSLSKWIAILQKQNRGQTINKEMLTKIEEFFDFYWSKNKVLAFESALDKHIVKELPEWVLQNIYINYLYRNFIYQFQLLFRYRNKQNKIVSCNFHNLKFREEVMFMLMNLRPRCYKVGELIQDQFSEVFEVLYIMRGKVGVGYRLFNDMIMAKVLR